jgi:hypothetical protein
MVGSKISYSIEHVGFLPSQILTMCVKRVTSEWLYFKHPVLCETDLVRWKILPHKIVDLINFHIFKTRKKSISLSSINIFLGQHILSQSRYRHVFILIYCHVFVTVGPIISSQQTVTCTVRACF